MSEPVPYDQAIRRGPTVKEQVFELIRSEIFRHERKPGSIISAKGLATKLKVSRTPVREAMEALARDGLISWVGMEGARIREVQGPGDLFEILTLRRAIEVEVGVQLSSVLTPEKEKTLEALLAEMRAAVPTASRDETALEAFYGLDEKYHRSLAVLAGMSRAEAFIANLMAHFRLFALKRMSKPVEILDDHTRIVEAIMAKRPSKIREAVTGHFMGTIDRRAPELKPLAKERWK